MSQKQSQYTTFFNRYILLFLAIWPIIYSFIFIGYWLFSRTNPPTENYVLLGTILMCHGLTMATAAAGIIFYLFHLYRNNRVKSKWIWALGIIFLSIISLPIYWWKYVK